MYIGIYLCYCTVDVVRALVGLLGLELGSG